MTFLKRQTTETENRSVAGDGTGADYIKGRFGGDGMNFLYIDWEVVTRFCLSKLIELNSKF